MEKLQCDAPSRFSSSIVGDFQHNLKPNACIPRKIFAVARNEGKVNVHLFARK